MGLVGLYLSFFIIFLCYSEGSYLIFVTLSCTVVYLLWTKGLWIWTPNTSYSRYRGRIILFRIIIILSMGNIFSQDSILLFDKGVIWNVPSSCLTCTPLVQFSHLLALFTLWVSLSKFLSFSCTVVQYHMPLFHFKYNCLGNIRLSRPTKN